MKSQEIVNEMDEKNEQGLQKRINFAKMSD
jgi:hypothetical protein